MAVAEVAAADAAEEATAGRVGAVAQEDKVTVGVEEMMVGVGLAATAAEVEQVLATLEGARVARVAASMREPGKRAPARWDCTVLLVAAEVRARTRAAGVTARQQVAEVRARRRADEARATR